MVNAKLIIGLIILGLLLYWFGIKQPGAIISWSAGGTTYNATYFDSCSPLASCSLLVSGVCDEMHNMLSTYQSQCTAGGGTFYDALGYWCASFDASHNCDVSQYNRNDRETYFCCPPAQPPIVEPPVAQPPVIEPPQPINLLDYIISMIRSWLSKIGINL